MTKNLEDEFSLPPDSALNREMYGIRKISAQFKCGDAIYIDAGYYERMDKVSFDKTDSKNRIPELFKAFVSSFKCGG
jgi:hypothetical protein